MRCSSPVVLRRCCLALAVLASACIADPHVVLHEDDPTGGGRAVPVSGDDDDAMVLVPAKVIAAPGSLAPNAPGNGDDDDKGGKKGKPKDAGAPEPSDDPPAPSASETTVPAFWLDVREVSAAAYGACVRAGACSAPAADDGCTLAAALGTHPINCVTLEHARAFCVWRGKRLPKNDEWTAASAGSTGRPYAWGIDPPSSERLNACGAECGAPSMFPSSDGWARTAPRGSFPLGQSPDGVLDLAGNVAEWVDLGGASVVRGGSYEDADPAAVGATSVRAVAPGGASPVIGFRCAKDG